jgi:5,10-methylene-tetrahydrofolate dehydrogenase/methenyl tetrahydrofolate cyclohydrolase
MERILGNVKEEATEGVWDLKMDGKVMMQFANISYDAEDHQFIYNNMKNKKYQTFGINVKREEKLTPFL